MDDDFPKLRETISVILFWFSSLYNVSVLPLCVLLFIVKYHKLDHLPHPWPFEIVFPFAVCIVFLFCFFIVATSNDVSCTLEITRYYDPSFVCKNERGNIKLYYGEYVFQVIITIIWLLGSWCVSYIPSLLNFSYFYMVTFHLVSLLNIAAFLLKLFELRLGYNEMVASRLKSKY